MFTFFIFCISTIMLFMIFMNFIIAVISNSYMKINEHARAHDYKQKANMIYGKELHFE